MSVVNNSEPRFEMPVGFPEIEYVYRHIEKSEALENVANRKIFHHLEHLHSIPMSSKIVFSLSGKMQHISLDVKVSGHEKYFCEAEDSSMYHAVDLVAKKLAKLMKKHKDQLKPKADKIVNHLDEAVLEQ